MGILRKPFIIVVVLARAFFVFAGGGGEDGGGEDGREGEDEGSVGMNVGDEAFAPEGGGAFDEFELPVAADDREVTVGVIRESMVEEDGHGLGSHDAGPAAHVEMKEAIGGDGSDVSGPVLEAGFRVMIVAIGIGVNGGEVNFGVLASKSDVANTFGGSAVVVGDKRADAANGTAGSKARGLVRGFVNGMGKRR